MYKPSHLKLFLVIIILVFNICICRIAKLEKEFKDRGINVSDDFAALLESAKQTDPENKFLAEWWSKQKELQSAKSEYGRRYSPSIIR